MEKGSIQTNSTQIGLVGVAHTAAFVLEFEPPSLQLDLQISILSTVVQVEMHRYVLPHTATNTYMYFDTQ